MDGSARNKQRSGWRDRLFEVIFEADTAAGRLFDVLLILCILLSVAVVMLDSVSSIHERYGGLLYGLEWVFTILFTVEYVLRLACAPRPGRYARSFFGVIDLLAILPTYVSIIFFHTRFLAVVRVLRVLRVFRVLKLAHPLKEANLLMAALARSRRKIFVFLLVVGSLVVILGACMYIIEGPENGFTSIPRSVYWAVVTLTTVGYGDISPNTALGQCLAAVVMILGYSIIVVPTGFVTVEMAMTSKQVTSQFCPQCMREGHDADAAHCKFCGAKL